MDNLFNHALSVFLGFFAVMNPVANTAVFVGLTGDADPTARRQTALKSLMTAFGIILFFCLLGKTVFHLFGITLPALRITGGVLIFLVGYKMLHGENSKLHHPSEPAAADNTALDVAISPLALPILAGPGTIATAMNFSAASGIGAVSITVLAFAVLCAITYGFFISGDTLLKFLGADGISLITRLMGLILAVIGTQMLIQGIHGATTLFA